MIPNQAHKMSSGSIVRQTPKIEVEVEIEPEDENKDEAPEGSHTMPDGTVMLDSEHEVDKHDTHDQSTHGSKGGKPSAGSTAQSMRLSTSDFRSMTNQDKVRAAEIMFGTNSRQHRQAQEKFSA